MTDRSNLDWDIVFSWPPIHLMLRPTNPDEQDTQIPELLLYPGHGTMVQILTLVVLLRGPWEFDSSVYMFMCFVDLEKTSVGGAVEVQYKVPGLLFKGYPVPVESKQELLYVSVLGIKSSLFSVQVGLRQGHLCSLMVFVVFTGSVTGSTGEVVERRVSIGNLRVSFLLCADDVFLLVSLGHDFHCARVRFAASVERLESESVSLSLRPWLSTGNEWNVPIGLGVESLHWVLFFLYFIYLRDLLSPYIYHIVISVSCLYCQSGKTTGCRLRKTFLLEKKISLLIITHRTTIFCLYFLSF